MPPAKQSPIPLKPNAYAEEAAVIERILNRIRFENDGKEVSETEAVVRIQSQAGVEQFGQLVFGYSPSSENLEIEYVRVRKPDGQVVVTPASSAQDFAPGVLREAPMYTDYRQRHISVAALQAGDVLEYRTVTKVETPLAAGNFWYEYTFPRGVVMEDDRLEVNVPKNRELKLKSPSRKPEIQDSGDRRIYIWAAKNLKPGDDQTNQEGDHPHPDVQLTTFTDWKQIAQWYAKLQSERMTVSADLQKRADEITRGAATPEEKTRRLYDFVARNIRYVSISLGVGRYQPHLPIEVLQNSYGDCKDKHTLFAVMMKAEGINSYPVLIDSSRKLDPDVPSPAQFDHVITAVRIGDKLTWLDTTPEVAPFGMILYQLRNKEAVLASDDSEGGLQRTPSDSPVADFLRFSLDGSFSDSGALDASVELSAQGDRDWPLRRTFRQMSAAQWKPYVKSLSESWGLAGDVEDVSLDSVEDTSKPFHLKYRLYREHYFQVPSAEVNFMPMPPMGVTPARESEHGSPERAATLDIGPAGEIDYRVKLHFPANYTVRARSGVKMSRDYGDYFSSYSVGKGLIEGERKLVIRSNEIPAARRADYDSFRNAAESGQDQSLACTIAAPTVHAAEAAAGTFEGTSTESQQAGVKALHEKNYLAAIDLLKRANELDPNLKDGMYDLGLAYAGAADHPKAIAAFRQQLKTDPNHKLANGNLAFELQQTGNNVEAVAAYQLQLRASPYDRLAHRDFGLLLAQLRRDSEARTELETVVATPPGDPEARLALAQVYARLGEAAKAQPLMQELTGNPNMNASQDIFQSGLQDDVSPAQSESDAQQVLYDIGAQFDAGEFDRIGMAAFSAMRLTALSWARIGWARFRRNENLQAMQFLNAAWLLSNSSAVADRLGQVYEKQGQTAKAEHMYALALITAGGPDREQLSRHRLNNLSTDSGKIDREIATAREDLKSSRVLKVDGVKPKSGSAHFNLVFDSSPRPELVEFFGGDESLRSASSQLRQMDFPTKFPDVSSVKIIRQGLLQCSSSGCNIELLPLEQ